MLDPQEAFLALTLFGYRNRVTYQCNPSIETLASKVGRSEKWVRKALQKLRSERVLWWQHRYDGSGKRTSNQYWLTDRELLHDVHMPDFLTAKEAVTESGTPHRSAEAAPCRSGGGAHIISRSSAVCLLCRLNVDDLAARWMGDDENLPWSDAETYRITDTSSAEEWIDAVSRGEWGDKTPREQYAEHALISMPFTTACRQLPDGSCREHTPNAERSACLVCRSSLRDHPLEDQGQIDSPNTSEVITTGTGGPIRIWYPSTDKQ